MSSEVSYAITNDAHRDSSGQDHDDAGIIPQSLPIAEVLDEPSLPAVTSSWNAPAKVKDGRTINVSEQSIADEAGSSEGHMLPYPASPVISETVTEQRPSTEAGPDMGESSSHVQGARLPMKKSLGVYGGLVIIGGSFGCMAGLAFLVFLWTGRGSDAKAANASYVWRAIMLGGWMTQVTTLCTLFIRVIAAAQSTLCTSMLASLILEKRDVRKSDVAFFSILRAINDGPRKLAELVAHSKQGIFRTESILVFSLLISTLALQFSSTILFADLREISIAGNVGQFEAHDYVAGGVGDILFVHSAQTQLPTYAMYGELASNSTSAPDSLGFSDTGSKRRAFLPLTDAANRTSVHSYTGNAVVLDSRVACMRPDLESATVYGDEQVTNLNASSFGFGQMKGTLNYGSSLRDAHSITTLCSPDGCPSADFTCYIPGGYEGYPGWMSSFCTIGIVGGQYLPRVQQWGFDWDQNSEPWSNYSLFYLFFTTNMVNTDWNATRNIRDVSTLPNSSFGEWNSFQLLPDRFVNVTLCFSTFHAELAAVAMTAKGPLTEPSASWTMDGIGNSSETRKLLGVDPTNQTPAEREILSVEDIRDPDRLSPVDSGNQTTRFFNRTLAEGATGKYSDILFFLLTSQGGDNTTYSGCANCFNAGFAQHPDLELLIQQTIETTGRAADALQAYTTSLGITLYDEFLKICTGTEKVQIAFLQTVQAAANCRDDVCKGLISVASLVGVHLLCVSVTIILYIRQVRYSMQGNIWHAVSQLTGDELTGILDKSNNLDDDAVTAAIRKENQDVLVRLEKSESGRVLVVKSPGEPEDTGKKGSQMRWFQFWKR